MAKWTREAIVREVQQAAAGCDGPLSKREFCQRSGIPDYWLYRLFPRGWNEIRQLAGVAPHPQYKASCSDEELLREFHRVACKVGAIPSVRRFARLAHVGQCTLPKRFGGKPGILRRYREWLEKNHPNSQLLQRLPSYEKPVPEPTAIPLNLFPDAPEWTKSDGTVFGSPLHFRGLRHAPTNENGVLFLFGMVSSELGLLVEAIQPAYPDCEAKRCIDQRHNRWQSVRIEFEFTSSKFREHGHDSAGCDLIVCWEHDWPDCPLEVIELRSVIAKLKG